MTAATLTFAWAETRSYPVSAQLAGETVARICKAEGICEPGRLVEEARAYDSPLHPVFDWDDERAAESYRKEQARHLLRSLRIVVDDRPTPTPAFVRVQGVTEDGGWSGYKPFLDLTIEERSQVEAEALAALNALRRRYAALQRFAPVWEAVDRLEV